MALYRRALAVAKGGGHEGIIGIVVSVTVEMKSWVMGADM